MATDRYIIMDDGFAHIDKDPNAQRNFTLDWSVWLDRQGETTIQSASASVASGLTAVGSVTISGSKTTIVLSGGTAGQSYKVTFRIVTSNGLIDDKTIVVDVKET